MAGSVLLIVVDNPAHRVLFNRHLGGTAHHLVFARDGEDGFDRFAEVKPDLIIAHVNVARLDGGILCQLVRQQPRGDAVPFVLLSEEFSRAEVGRERIAAVDADAFLPIPFDRKTLIERITPLLTFGRSEQSSRKIEAIPAAEILRRQTTEIASPVLERSKAVHTSDQVLEFSAVVQAIEGEVDGIRSDDEGMPEAVPRPIERDGSAWGGAAENVIAEPEAPVPAKKGPIADAADTVVSFQNPFAETSSLNQRPMIAANPDPGSQVLPKNRALEHEAVTHIEMLERQTTPHEVRTMDPKVRVPADVTAPQEQRKPASGPATVLENDESTYDESVPNRVRATSLRTEDDLAARPRPASRTDGRLDLRGERSDTPRIDRSDTPRIPESLRNTDRDLQQHKSGEYRSIESRERIDLRSVGLPRAEPIDAAPLIAKDAAMDEEPILDGPLRDRIEEPPISGVAPPVPDHSESSQQARLIAEPQRELTPSASDKMRSPLRESVPPAVRRGLDESQLGKRLAKRVRTMFRMLDEVDYYQILGVDPEAPADMLRRAYFDLSLEFHPDRFFLLRSGDLKEKIYAIYRRITEAYAVLSDERRRTVYDEGRVGRREKRAPPELREEDLRPVVTKESAAELTDVSATNGKAKRMLDLSRAALADGDVNAARLHLVLALAYEQDNAKLRAALDRVAEMSRP